MKITHAYDYIYKMRKRKNKKQKYIYIHTVGSFCRVDDDDYDK